MSDPNPVKAVGAKSGSLELPDSRVGVAIYSKCEARLGAKSLEKMPPNERAPTAGKSSLS